ncbi:MAG: hypothetical protein ACJ8D8_21920 [Microvirga sp.]
MTSAPKPLSISAQRSRRLALAAGARTKDIAGPGVNALGTPEMGDAIVRELERRA